MTRYSPHDARYRRLRARLKQAREDSGLTQIEVSRRLKRPSNYVNKVESGERRVQILDLEDLADLYRKPIGFFFPTK